MSTAQQIKEIYNYIRNADDRLVGMIYALVKEDSERIVAYSVDGKPLNKERYAKEVEHAEKDIANGKFTTQEALEQEIENW